MSRLQPAAPRLLASPLIERTSDAYLPFLINEYCIAQRLTCF
jgi:hypothetical protein